jgi:hypothetical protein
MLSDTNTLTKAELAETLFEKVGLNLKTLLKCFLTTYAML